MMCRLGRRSKVGRAFVFRCVFNVPSTCFKPLGGAKISSSRLVAIERRPQESPGLSKVGIRSAQSKGVGDENAEGGGRDGSGTDPWWN